MILQLYYFKKVNIPLQIKIQLKGLKSFSLFYNTCKNLKYIIKHFTDLSNKSKDIDKNNKNLKFKNYYFL
jgi:hypothetical protein